MEDLATVRIDNKREKACRRRPGPAHLSLSMGLFDVHAHLTNPRLTADLDAIIERARNRGLTTIVSNGLNPRDNQAVLELTQKYDIVKPALGLYPVDAVLEPMRRAGIEYPDERQSFEADRAIAWLAEHVEQAFAIGEIGLDGYWVPEQFWNAQDDVFCKLVELAMAADKVVIIHSRKRERRALELLEKLGARRVNWHCYGGRVSLARQIAERGHCFSIPANARRSESFTRLLQVLPRDQLLLETDCPYLAPDKDQLNEPANVSLTLDYAAELWQVSPATAAAQFSENFERLFAVSP
jgi:TatD DNase family protein